MTLTLTDENAAILAEQMEKLNEKYQGELTMDLFGERLIAFGLGVLLDAEHAEVELMRLGGE
jgi:hypothetical protein